MNAVATSARNAMLQKPVRYTARAARSGFLGSDGARLCLARFADTAGWRRGAVGA
jgi:hypothetical protein